MHVPADVVRRLPVIILMTLLIACEEPSVERTATLEERADVVVQLLQDKEWQLLSEVVHPDRGLTFSPYAYVDPQEAVTLEQSEVAEIGSDTTNYVWGVEDGSGFEIVTTPEAFIDEWIIDEDFASAQRGGRDEVIQTGNMLNNLPNAFYDEPPASASGQEIIFLEYHLPGEGQYGGMDWASLRLVFEREGETWYLIGVVRDRWTI